MTQQNKGSGMFRKLFVTAWLLMAWLCGFPAMAAPSLTALATPASATAPANVTLSVIVNADPDPVTVTQVEYFNGGTSLGVATGTPFSLALSNVPAGSYAIVAQATLADPQYPILISAPTPLSVTGSAPGATVYYIQTDQLNTPRAITDQSNTLVWKWDSDPMNGQAPLLISCSTRVYQGKCMIMKLAFITTISGTMIRHWGGTSRAIQSA
jgi:hypothetical protein